MKHKFRNINFLILMSTGISVMMDSKSSRILNAEDPSSFSEGLNVCLTEKLHGTLECVNRGALSALQDWNNDDEMNFGNIRLERAEGQNRDLLDLDYDPKDFGNVIKATSRLLERRNFKWNLSNLYPGLQMCVGPTLSSSGILEFVIDERSTSTNDRHIGTGRLLMRQLLLPFLLGFKFNLSSLIPLLFGVLVIVTKKAFLLSKVALIIISLLGWNSVMMNSLGQYPGNFNGFNGYIHNPYYEEHFPHQYAYRRYNRLHNPGLAPYSQHVIKEFVNVYERDNDEDEEIRKKKNFVWSKDG